MTYESNPANVGPGGLERLLDPRTLWLLVCFILALDYGSSLYLKTPLISVSLKKLDDDAPIGAVLVLLLLFAMLLALGRVVFVQFMGNSLEKVVHRLTLSGRYRIAQSEKQQDDEYLNRVRDYALANDHQTLFMLVQKHEEQDTYIQTQRAAMCVAGFLLIWLPTLDISTLRALTASQDAYLAVRLLGVSIFCAGIFLKERKRINVGWLYKSIAEYKPPANEESKPWRGRP